MVEEAKRCGGVKNWEGKKKIKKIKKKDRKKERTLSWKRPPWNNDGYSLRCKLGPVPKLRAAGSAST